MENIEYAIVNKNDAVDVLNVMTYMFTMEDMHKWGTDVAINYSVSMIARAIRNKIRSHDFDFSAFITTCSAHISSEIT